MILSVTHVTTYRYDAPVRGAVQSLRLTPSLCDGQRVIRWQIGVEGGMRGAAFRDGAGDWIESWSLRGPATEIAVSVSGEVATTDMAGVLRGHREQVPPEVYLRDTASTRSEAGLVDLAHAGIEGATGALDRAHRLAAAVAEAVAYKPGATEAHTTAAEALALGEGVCQDHAHVLIACARLLETPARYVSGYLEAGSDMAQEAAHAWAELWIEGLGWVGFDPANACCPDTRYIRLGSGLDAQDAAPVRGVARGRVTESLDVSVAVAAVQQ
ncbi:transglutaminase family protein [Frigidibacter oleivorans]|uniref:transglutaminase family protein n=1 Tax=Frigidibacter oleivorans TaxID=2487129 RepID=UPI000F8C7857|nr:transglutaminase family protein [Frigidibacter oleivorans]